MTSQGWRSTRPHPDSWSSSRSHYWLACWAGSASCAWHWSCCSGPPVSSATRGTGDAERRRMVKKRPALHRDSAADTHFDELHHEYHHLFNKILKALSIHYINHTPLHGFGAPHVPLLVHPVVKVIDVIYITR